MTTTLFMPRNFCPACNYLLDAATSIGEDAIPTCGDITICFKCGTVLQFNDKLSVELVPQSMLDQFDEQTKQTITTIVQGIVQLKGRESCQSNK